MYKFRDVKINLNRGRWIRKSGHAKFGIHRVRRTIRHETKTALRRLSEEDIPLLMSAKR